MQYLRLRYVRFSLVFATLMSVLFGSICSPAQTENTEITLGTATKGGGFQLFGQNLAEVINLTDTDLLVQCGTFARRVSCAEMKRIGLDNVTHVAGLTHTDQHYDEIVEAIAPQGRFGLIDDPGPIDIIESHRTRGKIVLEGFG